MRRQFVRKDEIERHQIFPSQTKVRFAIPWQTQKELAYGASLFNLEWFLRLVVSVYSIGEQRRSILHSIGPTRRCLSQQLGV